VCCDDLRLASPAGRGAPSPSPRCRFPKISVTFRRMRALSRHLDRSHRLSNLPVGFLCFLTSAGQSSRVFAEFAAPLVDTFSPGVNLAAISSFSFFVSRSVHQKANVNFCSRSVLDVAWGNVPSGPLESASFVASHRFLSRHVGHCPCFSLLIEKVSCTRLRTFNCTTASFPFP